MNSLHEDQKWVPTHVQVTVLRGRGLRGKGKHGTSDVYTIIQLGKEKYSTCVAEKTTEPEWREECSFELQPGGLERCGGGGGGELVLTVMHRAVIGLDVFLGQALIQLEKVFVESRCLRNEWYRLNSKSGKKEKERGDIQVTVQFTRNNLTASMYDLVMKDKSASTFGKLKERIKGKKRCEEEEDSASAIMPGGYGSLHRMRQRLPSDGGGEEDYEDDEGGEARRSKMRTFFLRGKLRKSSDTRSSTSLGSESSESSSRGGSLSPTAGISVVVSDLSNSPSNSSNLTADNSPEHLGDPSSLHCEFGDDISEITIAVPELPPCTDGSHAVRPVEADTLGPSQKTLPISTSLQNLNLADLPKGAAGDGRRWSFDKPGEDEKAAIAAALQRREEDGKKTPLLRIPSYAKEGQRKENLERCESTEVKHRGWFGSKESKPSLVFPPKLDCGTEPPPFGHAVDPVTPLHHTNPFSHITPPPLSSCNPFFPALQQNPFYEDINSTQPLKPVLPPLPFLSSARPPITQLFPQARNTNPTLVPDSLNAPPVLRFDAGGDEAFPEEEKQPGNSSNLFVEEQQLDLDESFDTFAAGRFHSPQEAGLEEENTAVKPGTEQKMNPFSSDAPDSSATPKLTNVHHLDLFSSSLDTIPEDENVENNNEMFNPTEELVTKSIPSKVGSGSPDPSSSGLGSSEEDFLSCNSSVSDKASAYSSDEAVDIRPGLALESPAIRSVNKSEEEIADKSHEWSSLGGLQSTVIQNPDINEKDDDVAKGSDSVVGLSLSLTSESSDPLPELSVLSEPKTQQESSISPDDITKLGDNGTLQDSPVPDLFSHQPSLFVTTSSPDAKHQGLPFESTTLDSSPKQPVMFDLLEFQTIPGLDLDNPLLHTRTPDHGNTLQSLYTSTDSQNFHSCNSNPFSSSFNLSEVPNSANSTLRGNLSEVVSGTEFGVEDFTDSEATSTGENQKTDSPVTLVTVTPGPTNDAKSSGGSLTESLDDKPLADQENDLQVTITGEIHQSEPSFKIAHDFTTQDPSVLSNFSGTLMEADVEKDLEGMPSEMQQSESGFGKTREQTATPEQSSIINNDIFTQEPTDNSSHVGSTSTIIKPLDVCDKDLTLQQSESFGNIVDQTVQYIDTSHLLPLDPFAPSASLGGMITESVVEKPWPFNEGDPWGRPTGEALKLESPGILVNQTKTPNPQYMDLLRQEPADPSTTFSGMVSESLVDKPWHVIDSDPWGRSTGEIQQTESFGIAMDLKCTSKPSDTVTNDFFPQQPTASSHSFGGTVTESPGIPDNDPWTSVNRVDKERKPSVVMINDILPLEHISTTTIFGETATDSVVDNPWGFQNSDPWKIQQSDGFGFAMDPPTQPGVMQTNDPFPQEDFPTSTNQKDFTESVVEKPWVVNDDTLTESGRQRSQSFGTPSTTFDKHPRLRASVMLQESFSSQPDLPTLTSAAPSFIPENGRFSLPSNSNTSTRSPPDIATALEQQHQQQEANQRTSPHPVKPLTSEEKRGEGRSVLGKLKSSISPGKNSHVSEQEAERSKTLTGGAGSYYHLTHSELVALLVRREAEMERQTLDFQQQKTLLAKREVELKRLKPQLRDLEDYIDTLLVQIMEQKPTLLQVRTKMK